MTGKDKHALGAKMLDKLIQGQRAGKSHAEITEGIRAGLGSDYLSLDEGLRKGSTVADPAKYARAMDGKDEQPRKPQRFERDLAKNMQLARERCAVQRGSQEYREKVIQQKKKQIHKAMNERETNEISARIRGYDVTLLRIPEAGADGKHKLKMFVNGQEIPDKQFDAALAEVAGLNDSKAFNVAAETGKELRDQAGVQGARATTQAGIQAATAPARAIPRAASQSEAMAGQLLGMLFRLVITTSRSR